LNFHVTLNGCKPTVAKEQYPRREDGQRADDCSSTYCASLSSNCDVFRCLTHVSSSYSIVCCIATIPLMVMAITGDIPTLVLGFGNVYFGT
jgi:hypothetical protein